jgi:hypothetical protein
MRKVTRSKRHKVSEPTEAPAAAAAAPEAADDPPTETEKPDRLAVLLGKDGRIEVDSMRSATKEKLKAALQDDSLRARLGMVTGPGSVEPIDTLFDANVCAILYGAASSIMVAVAVKQGYPVDQAQSVIPFTKDEVNTLAPLTGKVLDKWIPTSGKYKDEAILALALFGIVNGKFAQLKRPATVHPFRVEPPAAPGPEVPPAS